MVYVVARLPLTAFNDDWLHMARLIEEQKGLKPGDPRYEEIQMILDQMDTTQLKEVNLDD
jgi:hypothetical protein